MREGVDLYLWPKRPNAKQIGQHIPTKDLVKLEQEACLTR